MMTDAAIAAVKKIAAVDVSYGLTSVCIFQISNIFGSYNLQAGPYMQHKLMGSHEPPHGRKRCANAMG